MRRFMMVTAFMAVFNSFFYGDIPYDFDKNFRQEFTGIVIHHTGTKSDNASIKFLSDIQKQNVYKPVFDGMLPGRKIYSNHFYNGEETFICYHWLVYSDGRKIQVLKDIYKQNGKWYVDYMGWHAGDWDTNGKTVAIVVVGNYLNRTPSEEALNAMAEIIAGYKAKTGLALTVKGHREYKATACPGNKFLGENGWKKTLIKKAEDIEIAAEE